MASLTGNTATLRRRLLGVLTATGLSGATAVVLLSAPRPLEPQTRVLPVRWPGRSATSRGPRAITSTGIRRPTRR